MNRTLWAYSPHMLRDYLLTRGGAMLVLATVFVGPVMLAIQAEQMPPQGIDGQARQILLVITPILALIGTYGLVGQDFRLGYFRSLFSKPVSVPGYYAVLSLSAIIAFVLVQALSIGALALVGANAWSPAIALDATMRFLLLGSLTLAFSRVSRLDWIFAFFFYTLGAPLRSAYPATEYLRGQVFNIVLPPTHLLNMTIPQRQAGQISALVGPDGVVWESVFWIGGYALLFFIATLVLVRSIPLANAT